MIVQVIASCMVAGVSYALVGIDMSAARAGFILSFTVATPRSEFDQTRSDEKFIDV